MKKLVPALFLLLVYSSCNRKVKCHGDFLAGNYTLKKDLVVAYNNNDSSILAFVKEKKWDKISLVVEAEKYHFENGGEFFKKYEGTWTYSSKGFDSDCFLYIRQKTNSRNLPLTAFNIAVDLQDKTVILPFTRE